MTTSVGNIGTFSYINSTAVSADKVYVPVKKSVLIYSHLDHVSGVAAKSGQAGVSITKLQLLNALIDHASSIDSSSQNINKSMENVSEAQMDSMIKNLHSKIQTAIKTPYALTGAKPVPGELFSIQA